MEKLRQKLFRLERYLKIIENLSPDCEQNKRNYLIYLREKRVLPRIVTN